MIGRWTTRKDVEEEVSPKGFDDFDLRLGDMMRGERATLGKSLLDVQRELRIKASYIAAIENADPSAFDTPGFIAGYVRSYARYLNMDPDKAYAAFCAESGFATAHGMSAEASSIRKEDAVVAAAPRHKDPFEQPRTPFVPNTESVFSRIEPGAVGSLLVLVALVGTIGYGGWTVLREIQQVQVVPVDETPVVLAELDPLAGAGTATGARGNDPVLAEADNPQMRSPSAEALDRLYRPQALDVPVLVARDAPISTLDPSSMGTISAPQLAAVDGDDGAARLQALTTASLNAAFETGGDDGTTVLPQVVEALGPGITVVAARPAWVRIRSAAGNSLFQAEMEPGQTFKLPQLAEAPSIRVGESGAIYFAVDGVTLGPAGPRGQITANLVLDVDTLIEKYDVADMERDIDLARVVAELQTQPVVADE